MLGYDTADGSVAVPVAVLFAAGAAALTPAALLLLVGMLVGLAGAAVGLVVEIVESLRRRSDHRAFRDRADERVRSTLAEVGLDPAQTLDKRPHEFSGGQAQRICLARALVRDPSLLICDEPVSALDVSVQAQVLNLLADLTKRHDLSVVLIAHDLAVVKSMSDRIVVMYLGKVCEVATPVELFERPRHPYTRMLIDAIPIPDPNHSPSTLGRDLGELPSPVNPPSGCRFRTRCDRATELCAQREPEIVPTGAGSFVACHHRLDPLDAVPAVSDAPEIPASAVEVKLARERTALGPEPESPGEQPLLTVTGLHTHFSTQRGIVRAVDGVDLRISRGRTLGIVGESGSGKTVLSRSIMNLLPDHGVQRAGTVTLNGTRIDQLGGKDMRSLWGTTMAMIFQDPSQSLHPMYTIGRQITDPLRVHLDIDKNEARERAVELLSSVRIPDAARRLDEYPHQLSGGMRQRAMIAIALSCGPSVLCADEPTTALDVTVQAQVLDLLQVQQQDRMMAMILVTHDLGVVAGRADEVAVMYAGRIVEHAAVGELFSHPMHPYTRALLQSIPRLDDAVGVRRQAIDGRPPELIDRTHGCSFAPRCAHATQQCLDNDPELVEIAAGHSVACHHPIRSFEDMDHLTLARSHLDGNPAERSQSV